MAQEFEVSQWVPFRLEMVFAFFANPSDLPLLMPPKLQTRLEESSLIEPKDRPPVPPLIGKLPNIAAGVGSEILVSFYPFAWPRVRVKSRVRITEFEWNSHFCDEQILGPFRRFDHRHTTRAEKRNGVQGTLVTDTITYSLPFGIVGSLGNALVKRKLAETFAYRQERLPEVLTAVFRLADLTFGS
jgi:ligand-binding SRPBCC domain-containing protein